MQELVIVNASTLLSDAEVQAIIGPLQTQHDRDLLPAWGDHGATPVHISFANASDIPGLSADCWPIFLNKHSNEPGALGWHDDSGRVFGRVFVGDCQRFGSDWGVTLSHETNELVVDPTINRTWTMPDGRLAAVEACDPVEDDIYAYAVAGRRLSSFLLPAYFTAEGPGPFDFMHVLAGPCPTLMSGGYQSVFDQQTGWTQLTRERFDGLAHMKALIPGRRRQLRQQKTPT